MAYSTQNNSRDKDRKDDVNTRGIAFYNKEGFDPSALSIGFWNDAFLSLKINPALEKSKQTQSRVFDYEKTVSTALTIPLMKLLSHSIKTWVLPAIEAGEDKSISVQVGGDSLVTVGTGKRLTGDIRPFIAIHKSLNPSTKKPELSIFYEFNRQHVIEDFNESTGDYALQSNIHSELLTFIDIIDASIAALSKGGVHATRVVMKFFNDRLMNSINAIGTKVGADMPQYSRQNSGQSGSNHVSFSTPSSINTSSDMDAEYSTIGDISELMG